VIADTNWFSRLGLSVLTVDTVPTLNPALVIAVLAFDAVVP